MPVAADSIETLRKRILLAAERGADMVELRLDLMPHISDEELHTLREPNDVDVPLLLTIRDIREGGDWEGPDEEKLARFEALAGDFDFVDLEYAFWSRSEGIRRRIRDITAPPDVGTGGAEPGLRRPALILSKHDLTGRPATLQSDLLALSGVEHASVVKLAWRARTVRDNFEAFALLRMSPRPSIIICMGEDGLMSRVLARKFGAFASFASLEPALATAPGQVTIEEMHHLFDWSRLWPATRLYGVIGDPVAQSLSPHVHNAAFRSEAMDAVFMPIRVGPGYESFKAFMVEVDAHPWLQFDGFSVTMPHKEHALRFVRETGGCASSAAARVGAANTLVRSETGRWNCDNTDLPALSQLVKAFLPNAGGRALVLGAGGVARAAVAAIGDSGLSAIICNRTRERAEALAREFGAAVADWPPKVPDDARLLVNCTSIGMAPDTADSPVDPSQLRADLAVIETVYRPATTQLLRDAADRRCKVADGLQLFARQARIQFKLWTAKHLPVDFFENRARNVLKA